MQSSYQFDITQGSLSRGMWRLTWPMTISQALFMLPSVYDAVWLGRLGSDAQAAAGITMSVRITMISVLMALSLSGGAVVARYVGAEDQDKANSAVLHAILLMIAASGSLGVLGVILVRPLMSLGGADAATLPLAVRYARIIFFGLIAMELVPSIGGMLNAAGAPQLLLGMTLFSTGTLLIAEPLLVRWLDLEGAALALVGSNTVGMLWGLGVLVSGRAPVRLDLRRLHLDLAMMRRILRVALPAVPLRGAPNLALSLLTRFVSWYGAPVLAAWVIVQRIFSVALIPSLGFSRAAPAMVGLNLGAAQPERATRSVGLIARAATLVGGAIVALLVLLAPQVMALFSGDAETIAVGVTAIRVLSIGYLAFAVNAVFDMAQTGAGDTLAPMILNLISLWLVQVPVAYLLSRLTGLDANGIWLALTLGWIVQAVLMGLRFRQGHWKLMRVV
jgi:putative MATE family efflux protein